MQKITRQQLEPFLAKYATDKRLLDIGSGGSSYHRFFPNRVAIDIDPARKPDIVGDVHHLPCVDNEFEMVVSTEMLEHCLDPQQAVNEMMRVLKPGGLLLLTTRFIFPLHDAPNDYWRFTKYGLQQLFRGWEIVELREETKTISCFAALLQRLIFQCRFKLDKLTKGVLLCLTYVISKLDWMLVKEFGDINKEYPETTILTSGYYIVVKKIPTS